VAVDSAGDLFVGDYGNARVVELPAGGSQQALPLTGLASTSYVAVDKSGDVVVSNNDSVVESSPSTPSGSMAIAPASGPVGSTLAATSVTPCPMGGDFSSGSVTLNLMTPGGASAQTATATLDLAGNWHATLTVPAADPTGTYVLLAHCKDADSLMTQQYAYGSFVAGAASSGSVAPTIGSPSPAAPGAPTAPASGSAAAAGSPASTSPTSVSGSAASSLRGLQPGVRDDAQIAVAIARNSMGIG
jgi:hypothetical protein